MQQKHGTAEEGGRPFALWWRKKRMAPTTDNKEHFKGLNCTEEDVAPLPEGGANARTTRGGSRNTDSRGRHGLQTTTTTTPPATTYEDSLTRHRPPQCEGMVLAAWWW
mmetsp:Transcript_5994/g.25087  ORF Transcript_5994/g.25087 Transcript_5994/m.25087 type:complete len:108 (-) Transcript_5994:2787-3110(-)